MESEQARLIDHDHSAKKLNGDYAKMTHDYRESHMENGKGIAYNSEFYNNPYRRMVWKLEQEILENIIQRYYRSSEVVHLDFACGTGRILRFLSTYAKKQVGMDVSPSMLEVANTYNLNAEIIEGDITKHDVLGNRRFNLITAFRFFPNAQPELRNQVMKALSKHLDDNGHIIFNNHKNTGSTRNRLARLAGRSNYKGMSMAEVKTLVEENNLVIDAVYAVCIFPASEKRQLLPIALLEIVERILSRISPLKIFGENHIIVCKRSTVV